MIPLMKKSGYSSRFAGAVESVASTGGQIMPPIMGAAAFIMAEFLQIQFVTFSAKQLRMQQGDFSGSDFVSETVGVDNVCERAAVAAARAGASLILKKRRMLTSACFRR